MFDANVHFVVFGVNESLNKRCVLSTDPKDIVLPKTSLSSDFLKSINEHLIAFLNEYIIANPIELMPQLINIHHACLAQTSETDSLEIIYGFIVDYKNSINDQKAYWIDFDPMKEHKLSLVLLETLQKLL